MTKPSISSIELHDHSLSLCGRSSVTALLSFFCVSCCYNYNFGARGFVSVVCPIVLLKSIRAISVRPYESCDSTHLRPTFSRHAQRLSISHHLLNLQNSYSHEKRKKFPLEFKAIHRDPITTCKKKAGVEDGLLIMMDGCELHQSRQQSREVWCS